MSVNIEKLERIGFSVNESKVYLTLIRIGSSFAGRIAKEASMDRSSTYNALNLLIKRGIVSTVHENKRTIYVPANPAKITDYFKEKEEMARLFIPELQSLFAVARERKTVTLFQGFRGVKTVFEDILRSVDAGEEYLIMGSEGQFSRQFPNFSEVFRARKEKKGVKTRMLLREGLSKEKKGKHTQYREFPIEVISPSTMNIYGDKVAILIWNETPEAIMIENEDINKTFRSYFEFMWKHAKPLETTLKKK